MIPWGTCNGLDASSWKAELVLNLGSDNTAPFIRYMRVYPEVSELSR
jgi:hypothetical protein